MMQRTKARWTARPGCWTGDSRPGETSLVIQSLETRTAFSVAPLVAAVPAYVRDVTVVGSVAYFVGGDSVRGDELWRSDGTYGGTGVVKDIRPGPESSYPGLYQGQTATIGSTLFFTANDGVRGLELWKTDGTEAGTVLVKDIAVGTVSSSDIDGNPIEEPAGSYPGSLVAYQGAVYFVASDGVAGNRLWKSDGTEGGTQPVTTAGPTPASIFLAGTMLLVAASDDQTGSGALLKLDASGTALELLASGDSRSFNSLSNGVVDIGGKYYFTASSFDSGTGSQAGELWSTDGTAAGTTKIDKAFSAAPEWLTAVGGTLFFVANDGTSGSELWKSDGTAAGTVIVKDIATGTTQQQSWDPETEQPTSITVPNSSFPQSLKRVGGSLLFTAYDGKTGYELWKSDGTAAGTQLVKDLTPGSKKSGGVTVPNSSVPGGFTEFKGSTYFQTSSGSLWKTDGSAGGTTVVKSMPGTNSGSGSFASMAVLNGKLFFSGGDGKGGQDLWASDGTPAGTIQTKSIPAAVTAVDLPANGTFAAGQSLDFTVRYNGPVTVVGKPTIGVTVGNKVRQAVYSSGSGTGDLVFTLKVTAGDADGDGVAVASKISGKVQNKFSSKVGAMPTLPSLATSGIRVDALPPQVLSVLPPAAKTYTVGETLSFSVAFSEVVKVSGTPQIAVTIGKTVRQAVYVSGSDSATLIFRVSVQPGDAAPKGIGLARSIVLNGGEITDGVGNRAALSFKPVKTSLVKVA